MTTTQETRKYQVLNRAERKVKTVTVQGAYGADQAWREAAARAAGWPEIDASYAAENVLRLFPWWLM